MAFADLPIAAARFALVTTTGEVLAPLTRVEQIHDTRAARWEALLTSPPMRRETAGEWIAWVVEQRGISGRFEVGDPAYWCVAPQLTGVTLSAAATQGASTLALSGISASQLAAGGYLQIGTHLGLIVSTPLTAGSDTVVTIFPRLRAAVAVGTAVDVRTPAATMRLADDAQARWSVGEGRIYTLSVACVEALV